MGESAGLWALKSSVLLVGLLALQSARMSAAFINQNSSTAYNSTEPTLLPTIMPVIPMIMPGCPKDNVLTSFNPLEFPGRFWQSMSVEQQALHPINLVFLNLVGIPSTDRQGQIAPCLDTWGIRRSNIKRLKKSYRVGTFPAMSTEVVLMRTSRDLFVVFRATDDDWVADFNCMYSEEVNRVFNAPRGHKKIQLHKGFWGAYKAVGSQLQSEIHRQVLMLKTTNPFGKPGVWFIGHSLGGALGSIAALRLHNDPLFLGRIGGVVTYGSPRVGNEAWQSLYNDKLMDVTLRWANFRDMFAELPNKDQYCMSILQPRLSYSFRHVGRAVQLCPTPDGLERFVFHPKGTEATCSPGEFPSIATHLIGHYFDGWRRAYAQRFGIPAGLLLSTSTHVRSVMCLQCAVAVKPYPLPTNKAARNDGVVTCVNAKSCQDKLKFALVSWSGLAMTSFYREDATCDAATYTCQVPIPGSQTVMKAVSRYAANLTLADIADLAAALLPEPYANATSSLKSALLGGSTTYGNISSDSNALSAEVPGISAYASIASAAMTAGSAMSPPARANNNSAAAKPSNGTSSSKPANSSSSSSSSSSLSKSADAAAAAAAASAKAVGHKSQPVAAAAGMPAL
ncbi:class 3-domain-containing protein [Scenedesmus sp. NREL 46B-D3]|nr:class 3-domain-containing protein [Scenedesmus sp. NREL 46B-D3]